jgi:predicted molibdopterin-dependent oxidoreductase YjgC
VTVGPARRLTESVARGAPLTLTVDGEGIAAFLGETVAAAIFGSGRRTLRVTRRGAPRSLFCGIGVCHECRMIIDGKPNTRACLTRVRPGMVVRTQHGLGETAAP